MGYREKAESWICLLSIPSLVSSFLFIHKARGWLTLEKHSLIGNHSTKYVHRVVSPFYYHLNVQANHKAYILECIAYRSIQVLRVSQWALFVGSKAINDAQIKKSEQIRWCYSK